eukprot:351323-Chlamydomonas_euryale.AAC.9
MDRPPTGVARLQAPRNVCAPRPAAVMAAGCTAPVAGALRGWRWPPQPLHVRRVPQRSSSPQPQRSALRRTATAVSAAPSSRPAWSRGQGAQGPAHARARRRRQQQRLQQRHFQQQAGKEEWEGSRGSNEQLAKTPGMMGCPWCCACASVGRQSSSGAPIVAERP